VSEYTAITDVSDSLLQLLRDNLVGLVTSDHVTLASPADVVFDTAPWLTVFLYQVTPNAHLRNDLPERLDGGNYKPAPTSLDLFYMLIPYANSRDTEYQILGRVVQALASYPVLTGSRLRGSLAGSAEELHVVPTALAMEELLRLWNTFNNRPYKVSLTYQIAAIKIDSLQPPVHVAPVVERSLRVSRIP
jgi:hypothetical protein